MLNVEHFRSYSLRRRAVPYTVEALAFSMCASASTKLSGGALMQTKWSQNARVARALAACRPRRCWLLAVLCCVCVCVCDTQCTVYPYPTCPECVSPRRRTHKSACALRIIPPLAAEACCSLALVSATATATAAATSAA